MTNKNIIRNEKDAGGGTHYFPQLGEKGFSHVMLGNSVFLDPNS